MKLLTVLTAFAALITSPAIAMQSIPPKHGAAYCEKDKLKVEGGVSNISAYTAPVKAGATGKARSGT